jgi:hypothetical protein
MDLWHHGEIGKSGNREIGDRARFSASDEKQQIFDRKKRGLSPISDSRPV